MRHDFTDLTPSIPLPPTEAILSRQLVWPTGMVLLKTRTTTQRSENTISNKCFAVGFGFQHAEGSLEWELDGTPVLSRHMRPQRQYNDLVVLPAGSEFHGTGTGLGECLWLHFNEDALARNDAIEAISTQAMIDTQWSSDHLSVTLTDQIREECHHGFPRGAMFLETAATMLVTQLSYVLAKTAGPLEKVGALARNKLRIVTEFIESNTHRNVSLTELADQVHLSPIHFCRAFKAATGRPPHQYQIERRIEQAKVMLHCSELPLVDIALAVGFSSHAHFCNHFRRVMGVTPGKFRSDR